MYNNEKGVGKSECGVKNARIAESGKGKERIWVRYCFLQLHRIRFSSRREAVSDQYLVTPRYAIPYKLQERFP